LRIERSPSGSLLGWPGTTTSARTPAIRRVAPTSWTVSARRDILTDQQHDDLADVAHFHHGLTVGEATTLLAAHVFGAHPDYAGWREDHLDDEHTLKTSGLLRSGNGPHHARPTEDVQFSLGLYPVHPNASNQQKEH
jgi:hypothetical protein